MSRPISPEGRDLSIPGNSRACLPQCTGSCNAVLRAPSRHGKLIPQAHMVAHVMFPQELLDGLHKPHAGNTDVQPDHEKKRVLLYVQALNLDWHMPARSLCCLSQASAPAKRRARGKNLGGLPSSGSSKARRPRVGRNKTKRQRTLYIFTKPCPGRAEIMPGGLPKPKA